jgi:hypothetical protein
VCSLLTGAAISTVAFDENPLWRLTLRLRDVCVNRKARRRHSETSLNRSKSAWCTAVAVGEGQSRTGDRDGAPDRAGCHRWLPSDDWSRHLPMNGGVLTTLVRMPELQLVELIVHPEPSQRVLIAALLVN